MTAWRIATRSASVLDEVTAAAKGAVKSHAAQGQVGTAPAESAPRTHARPTPAPARTREEYGCAVDERVRIGRHALRKHRQPRCGRDEVHRSGEWNVLRAVPRPQYRPDLPRGVSTSCACAPLPRAPATGTYARRHALFTQQLDEETGVRWMTDKRTPGQRGGGRGSGRQHCARRCALPDANSTHAARTAPRTFGRADAGDNDVALQGQGASNADALIGRAQQLANQLVPSERTAAAAPQALRCAR